METRLLLKELQSKATFPEAEFPPFLELFEPLVLKKKDQVYRAGDTVKFVLFVVKGCMRHYYMNEEGIERTVLFAEENWWVGDIVSLRSGNPTNLNLQAIEDCEVLTLRKDNFEYGLERFRGFHEYYTKGTQKTYTRLQEQVGQSLADSAETKYLRLLKERPSLIKRAPLNLIANYLGLTPETLSRVRKKIQTDGFLDVDQ